MAPSSKKEGKVNVSGKPKHSLDVNCSNGKSGNKSGRSAATVRRLKMANARPKWNKKGKILREEFSTRIKHDRNWFGNT